MKKWLEFLNQIEEDYLIGISNKGIVKRAQKDLEKIDITYEESEDNIALCMGDVACNIVMPIGESTCSCPARTICKHIIMGIWYLKKEIPVKECGITKVAIEEKIKETEISQTVMIESNTTKIETEDRKVAFQELKSFPLEKLKKIIGKKRFLLFSSRFRQGNLPLIEEKSIVTVTFLEDATVVKLLEPIEYSSCTCHKKSLCIHKAEALLFYQLSCGVYTLEQLEEKFLEEEKIDYGEIKKIGEQFFEFLEDRIAIGLARSSPSISDSFERMAIIAHNQGLPDFERMFRELGEEYRQYFKRMVSFRGEKLLEKLTYAYLRTKKLMEANTQGKFFEAAGEFKSSYYEVPTLFLVGMGERSFQSKSGYEGYIIYFMEKNTMEWYTYTKARPTFYEEKSGKTRHQGREAAPWGLSCTMEELAEAELKLYHPKVNKQHRLSASAETKGELYGKTQIKNYYKASYWYENFISIFEYCFENCPKEQEMDELHRLIFVKADRIGKSVYDSRKQVYSLPLYDKENHVLDVCVHFSSNEKYVIQELERLEKRLHKKEIEKIPVFFGIVIMEEKRMTLYPLAFYE